ncbi:hypothetical protein Cpir12675_004736 [Ceratocystis pirilliformis]|uniref:Uncharacterized protein n=1 Tax=Ceratocystis pirilliformis TaxID=259994 RepID=A0ABR3YUE8_9PEZI
MHFLSTLALALSALGVQAGTVLQDHGYSITRTNGGNYMVFSSRYDDRMTPVSTITVDSQYKIASISALFNHLEVADENNMSLSAIFDVICDLEQTLPKWTNFVVFDKVDVPTSKLANDYRRSHDIEPFETFEVVSGSEGWKSFLETPYYKSLQELMPEKAGDVKKIIFKSVQDGGYWAKNPKMVTRMFFSFLANSGPYDDPEVALAEVNGWGR